MSKIITFQKTLYRIFFTQHYFIKQYTPLKKIEAIMQPICWAIVLMSGFIMSNGFNEFFWIMCIVGWLQLYIFPLLCQGNFIFLLPLKRSFIIKNIYFFATFNILIVSMLLLYIITRFSDSSFILGFISWGGLSHIINSEISLLQGFILAIAYAITYLNVIITIYFAKKVKIKIALYAMFALSLVGINIYLAILLTKLTNGAHINLNIILAKIPNSWSYVDIAVCMAIVVSACGMFIAIRLDRQNSTQHN
jgi:hypothetical protein